MSANDRLHRVYAEVAVKNKLLTKEQAQETLRAVLKDGGKDFLETAKERKHLDAAGARRLDRAVKYRELRLDSKLYGQIAVRSKLATMEQVKACLDRQDQVYKSRGTPPHLGELLRADGLSAESDLAIRKAMAGMDRDRHVAKPKLASIGDLEALAEGGKAPSGRKTAGSQRTGAGSQRAGAAKKPSGRKALGKSASKKLPKGGKKAKGSGSGSGDTLTAAPDDPGEDSAAGNVAPKAKLGVDETSDSTRIILGPSDLDIAGSVPKGDTEDAVAAIEALGLGDEDTKEPAATRSEKPAAKAKMTIDVGSAVEDEPRDLEDAAVKALASSSRSETKSNNWQADLLEEGEDTGERPALSSASEPEAKETGAASSSGGEEAKPADSEEPPATTSEERGKKTGKLGKGLRGSMKLGKKKAEEEEAPAEAAAPAAQADMRDVAFEAAFTGAEELATFYAATLVRAKEKAGGATRLVVRLPEGAHPSVDQVTAYREDAAKIDGLGLTHACRLLWVGKDGTFAVYEDAAGTPASALDGSLDRMASGKAMKQLTSTLAAIHDAGAFARELRPELTLVEAGETPMVRLVGVGMARLAEGVAEPPATDPYVPPERRRQTGRADARTDLFGLGNLLIRLVTGKDPTGLEAKDPPDLPGAMRTFIQRTLDPVTGKRYASVRKTAMEVERFPGAKQHEVKLKRE